MLYFLVKIQINWYVFVLISQGTANIKTHFHTASVEIILCFKIYIMQGWILISAEHTCLTLKFLRMLRISPCENLALTVPYHTYLTFNRTFGNASNRYRLQLFTLKWVISTLWGSLSAPPDVDLTESSQTPWCFSVTRIWKQLHTKKQNQQQRANESVKMMEIQVERSAIISKIFLALEKALHFN